ncbi:hypothetical protein CY34DRAFT_808828 [Suillus luteus UH-Slu-Lm8-n1]|uniref:Uncharacterized protein n=1 Tax=Suillus luteus UH-Slu-Lm8-n1 TaxID=930992 RepID=A0A0D0AB06_9AGAM|nr:hypothetical protein CY34DRAFT_808828 [Suillus luteus UH-Slu-Lm8-n1]
MNVLHLCPFRRENGGWTAQLLHSTHMRNPCPYTKLCSGISRICNQRTARTLFQIADHPPQIGIGTFPENKTPPSRLFMYMDRKNEM